MENQKEIKKTPENEIRVTTGTNIERAVSRVEEAFKTHEKVLFSAINSGIPNLVLIVEICKAKILGVHQLNVLETLKTATKDQEGVVIEGKEKISTRFRVELTKSKQTDGEKGSFYQEPYSAETIKEILDVKSEPRGDGEFRGGRGRGGRGGGFRGGRGEFRGRGGEGRGRGEYRGRGEGRGRGEFRGRGEGRGRGEFRGRGEGRGRGEFRGRGDGVFRGRGDGFRGGRGDGEVRGRGEFRGGRGGYESRGGQRENFSNQQRGGRGQDNFRGIQQPVSRGGAPVRGFGGERRGGK
jgi:hypothetical protein